MDASTLGFGAELFDFVVSSDVLEHIGDDASALAEWRRVLKPRGRLLVMVPAFGLLWSDHDVANRHWRRYTANHLSRGLVAAGFTVERAGYWNFSLFLPVLAIRLAGRVLGRASDVRTGDLRSVPKLVDRALYTILQMENQWLLRCLDFPVGVSAFALAHRGN